MVVINNEAESSHQNANEIAKKQVCICIVNKMKC